MNELVRACHEKEVMGLSVVPRVFVRLPGKVAPIEQLQPDSKNPYPISERLKLKICSPTEQLFGSRLSFLSLEPLHVGVSHPLRISSFSLSIKLKSGADK
jgi:hypothetical protein